LGIPQARLSIVFVTASQIRRLNRHFRKQDRATDVLAFDFRPATHPGSSDDAMKGVDGEIVVSATAAARQGPAYGLLPYQELILYVVHGILHLSGYDDYDSSMRRKMRMKEQQVMGTLFPECGAISTRSR